MTTHPVFADLDTHLLRVGHRTLLDHPLDPETGAHVWVATIWPDRAQPAGWGRLVWQRGGVGRGWIIEPLTHLGDVVEFGADTPAHSDRWYGYVHAADDTSLTLVGPYPNPADAHDDGNASLARWRDAHERSSLPGAPIK
jgi:hypothetical protein